MKTKSKPTMLLSIAVLIIIGASAAGIISFTKKSMQNAHVPCTVPDQKCVMKTIFGLDGEASFDIDTIQLNAKVSAAIDNALTWIASAQSAEGGWGAGMHLHQDIMDPHEVSPDPATTAVVSLALLRTGNTLNHGKYSSRLINATRYLLKAVEDWKDEEPRLTSLTGTQPQVKLGQNIDAILTARYFTSVLKYGETNSMNVRIKQALAKCIKRIEKEQDVDGGWKDGGWAPVLQSALADNALESAGDIGVSVDTAVLVRSKTYQKGNFDTATKSVITGKSAGVMLYSLSSTTRSSAKEAKKVKDIISKAKKEGKVDYDAKPNEKNLVNAGVDPAQAKEMMTSYMVNESSKREAMKDDVMNGFGSNGGEEFLSYLMTGESILMQNDATEWKKWYDQMSKKIVDIQNADGSWNGHHCITSPVFCTATCLLILSVQNDMQLGND